MLYENAISKFSTYRNLVIFLIAWLALLRFIFLNIVDSKAFMPDSLLAREGHLAQLRMVGSGLASPEFSDRVKNGSRLVPSNRWSRQSPGQLFHDL